MQNCLSPFFCSLRNLSCFTSYAVAKPVTTTDLAGRTICYSNGEKATYFRNGKYENNKIGNGTWSVTSVGVQLNAQFMTALLDFEIGRDRTILIPAYNMIGMDCK